MIAYHLISAVEIDSNPVRDGYFAFQKVRQSSQDKAVLNNARQLSAASGQNFLGNDVSAGIMTNLAGATNYVKAANTGCHECYPDSYTGHVQRTCLS